MTLVEGPGPGITDVTVWTLEQTSPSQLRRAPSPGDDVQLVRVEVPVPELNRFLYTAVGGDWYWVDRLEWTWERWRAWVERPGHETWLAVVRGAPAGYVELDGQDGGAVEVAYFGLLRQFQGRGIGGWLLGEAVARAWSLPGTRRVWVHTCSLDGPTALRTYEARGFEVVATAVEHRDTRGGPPGPWPGAQRRPPTAEP